MSNNTKKYPTTKLKGTEMLARYARPHSSLSSNTDLVTSGSSHASNVHEQNTVTSNPTPKLISASQQPKCGGRGLAIERLTQSIRKTPNGGMQNSSNNYYSNPTIEHYFKNLKEKNANKLKEDNEKIWGGLIHTNKNS